MRQRDSRLRGRRFGCEPLEERTLLSLVASYSFDQGAGSVLADLSGNGNNGTITNATWTTAGKYGDALSFSGATGSWVTINDAASLRLTTGMTLEAWVNPSSLSSPGGNWAAAIAKEHVNSYNDISYALYAGAGTGTPPAGHILVGSNDYGAGGGSQLALNAWAFLSATYDGSTLRTYVNGAQVGSQSVGGSISTTTDPLKIGGDWSGEMFTGLIDNVRIYNNALTAAQIQADMTRPLSTDTTPPTVVITSPAKDATVAGTVTATTNTSDNVAVSGVQFQLDGVNLGAFVTTAPYSFTWDTTKSTNAGHILTAIAYDTSGNSTTSSPIYVTVGNASLNPLTLTITTPGNGTTVGGAVALGATASDTASTINGVQFQVDGVNVGGLITAAPYTYGWDSTTAANGSHTIAAQAADAAGNKTSAAINVNVSNSTAGNPSVVGQWSGVNSWPLVAINMVLMKTGKVLMWDGGPSCIGATSATIWDPGTNTFTPVPLSTLPNVRDLFCSNQTVLADGRVLVVGGHECVNPSYTGLATANIFDPVTQTWTQLGDMAYRRWYPNALTLPDGRALVTAGSDVSVTSYIPIPEIFDPATNTFTQLTGANQTIPNYPFMFVLPDGRVLAAGSAEAKMGTYVLNTATQTWSVVDPTVLDAGSAVEYLPGKIMKAGGSYLSAPPDNGGGTPSAATTYVIDMNQSSPVWRQTGSMANKRTHLNLTVLPDDSVLATGGSSDIGGVNPANAVYAAEMWNATTQTWTTMASEAAPRLYHSSALLLPDGTVLAAGGGHNYYNNLAEYSSEIYSPPYLFKGARPTIASSPTDLSYGSSFFVGTPDATNIASVSIIENGSVTHAFNTDQHYVPLAFTQTAGGLNVTAPANSNLAVPGYYMLFIVNKNGVPSIAPFVHLPAPGADTQPPTAPTSLNASAAAGGVSLTWTASTDNVGVTGYNVYRSTTSGFTASAGNLVGHSTTASYSDAASAGTYYYLATAFDAAGNQSAPSNQASATVTLAVTKIQVVQHATQGYEYSTSGLSLAFPSNNTAGDFLIVTGTAARPRSTITISDSAGNIYVPALSGVVDPTQDVTAYVWYVVNAKGGANTVTLTPNGGADALEIHISEWTGINKAAPLDQTSYATGVGAAITSGTKTTTQNGELIFGYTFPNQNSTAGAGFTGLSLVNGDLDEYQIQTSAGPIAATFTQTSDTWLALMATFNPASQDTQAPTAPGNLAASGSIGAVSLSWSAATDNVGVAGYKIYRSTTSGFTPSSANLVGQTSGLAYTDGVAAGTYYYVVTAYDAAGNQSAASGQAVATATADATPPTVSITNPAGGATVSGLVNLAANASDNVAVASVQFQLDGVNLGPLVTAAPYKYSWDSSTAANGGHSLTAIAKDPSGNKTTSAAVAVTVNNTSLVGAYAFNEGTGTTTADTSGYGNNGTVSGASWTTAGKYGNALTFNGTSSLVVVNDAASLNLSTGMTLEAWVNPTGLSNSGGNWVAAISKEHKTAGNDISYALYAAAGTNTPPAVHVYVNNVDYGAAGGGLIALNTWTFLAGTYDGATLRMYVNGILVGSSAVSGSISETSDPLKIGGDWSNEMFKGTIDNVRINNKALTQAQIQADMGAALGGTAPSVVVVKTKGLTATSTTATLAATSTQVVLGPVFPQAGGVSTFGRETANRGTAATLTSPPRLALKITAGTAPTSRMKLIPWLEGERNS